MNMENESAKLQTVDRTAFSGLSCLIFDYGGTLDTNARHWAHVLWEGYRRVAETLYFEVSLSAVTESQFREAYVFGERALAKSPIVQPEDNFRVVLLKKLEREVHFLVEKGYWKAGEADCRRAVTAIADYCYDYAARTVAESRKVLCRLKERYSLVLVSNFYGNIHAILRDFDLELFGAVIESAVVGVRKPDPAIYQLGVEAAGVPAAACLVVGDAYDKDMVPAKAVGCRAVWLKGEGWTREERDEQLPDAVITRLEELLDLLP